MDWDYPSDLTDQAAAALAKIGDIVSGLPAVTGMTPREARASIDRRWIAYAQSLLTGKVVIGDAMLPLPGGPMRVRSYDPAPQMEQPMLIFVHGGGWVLRAPESSDYVCEELALDLSCKIVSLDYPLAPEHPCPRAVEACAQAVRYLARRGLTGLSCTDVQIIAGESSGANIALATLLELKNEPECPAAGILVYGVYDHDHTTRSHLSYGAGAHGLSSAVMDWYWAHYRSGDAGCGNAVACPLRADLRGLPPLFLAAAQFDCLRDDTSALAGKLKDIGVPVETFLIRDGIHGCLNLSPLYPQLATMRTAALDFLKRHAVIAK